MPDFSLKTYLHASDPHVGMKILIANRGEIALRVIRTCRELGIDTVAVYSKADSDSLHVRFADEAVCIGPASSQESYLRIDRIIAAAEITHADAIHPGYGFLAESAMLSAICQESGITFIGPSPRTIELMGDKSVAKKTMQAAGVPVVPGSEGVVASLKDGLRTADAIGYPVMLKASAGGGGRGMRAVFAPEEFERHYHSARTEAKSAFANDDLYLEKLIEKPRHVEIQVMGDGQGTTIHLGERECSIQRRHQKLVEESPSPVVTPELREAMGQAAIAGAHAVEYKGAGTVEFLVDAHGNFYFMEMNTRIQVEHPVTEEVAEVDIVAMQIAVAQGERLEPQGVSMRGHSIECRINAEDPFKDFRPAPGQISVFNVPGGPGVRVDTHAYGGYVIPPYYDSMIAKLIVHASSREAAITRMQRALGEFVVEGIPTTIPFHQQLLAHPDFVRGTFDTHFLEHFTLSEG